MENNKSSSRHNFNQKSTDYKKFNKNPIQKEDSIEFESYNAYKQKTYKNKHKTHHPPSSKNPNYYQEHQHKISENSENEFSYLTIQNLKNLHQYSGDILLSYLENLQPIPRRLDKTKKLESFMDLIMDLLNKLCSIDNFRHANFIKEFFLSKCFIENIIKRLKDYTELMSENVPKILLILKRCFITFLKYLRDLTFISIKDCLECIETLIDLQPNNKELKVLQSEFLVINTTIKSINLDMIKLKIEEKEKKEKILKNNLENIEILYNNHPVHPTIEEISNIRPNNLIFPHLKKGPYGSLEHYLNNMFFLLKEDFIARLRFAVESLSQSNLNDVKFQENAYLYKNIKLIGVQFGDNGQYVTIRMQPFKNISKTKVSINWKNTKRLTFRGLIILSNLNLTKMIFATVFDKPKPEILTEMYEEYGDIDISIKSVIEDFNDQILRNFEIMQSEGEIIAFEAKTFYESYNHCLKRIKEFPLEEIPFVQEIVLVQFQKKSWPGYLKKNNSGNFYLNTDFNSQRLSKSSNFNIFRENWPFEFRNTLDSSQYEALKNILTNSISIIQGPPGTGKTYVGALAVKILLENKSLWDEREENTNDIYGRNKKFTKKSPLMIIAYTNHALDQFLTNISKFTSKIVRIGGRCQDELLKPFTLIELRKQEKRFVRSYRELKNVIEDLEHVKKFIYRLIPLNFDDFYKNLPSETFKNKIDNQLAEITNDFGIYFDKFLTKESMIILFNIWRDDYFVSNEIIDKIILIEKQNDNKPKKIKLLENYKKFEDQKIKSEKLTKEIVNSKKIQLKNKPEKENDEIFSEEEDEFLEENRRLELDVEEINFSEAFLENVEKKWNVNGFKELIEQNFFQNIHIWHMTANQRNLLINYCYYKNQNNFEDQFNALLVKYYELTKKVAEERLKNDINIINTKDIVGLTVTGCAKYSSHLNKIASPITVIEEAAEVLEAHTIATLTKYTQHLILIGDHKQLRPKVESYELEIKYNLNISLFERLINNGIGFAKLQNQRRMRPEFADFIRIIYNENEYNDHKSVLNLENINGIDTNLAFFSHHMAESENQGMKSKVNVFEAQFITKFTRYLLQQKYRADQITILTMYVGQTINLKKLLLENKINQVRVATVDNYQGEENDIILLSLVRSNNENILGFTQDNNRICVCMSRARKGLYVFGNFDCLRNGKGGELWQKMILLAEKKKVLVNSLRLCCQNHKKVTIVSSLEDFKSVPEGGCKLVCNITKPCGHICKWFCHNSEHLRDDCHEKCYYIFPHCNHRCTKICKLPCDKCEAPVERTLLCGHNQLDECYKDLQKIKCRNKCPKILKCGHICSKICSEPCSEKNCKEIVEIILPCNHRAEVACNTKSDNTIICQKNCKTPLPCGHKCFGSCNKCFKGTLHLPCNEKCQKILLCGHKCNKKCSEICDSCQMKCDYKCCNKKCDFKCGEPCFECKNVCNLKCKHYKCEKLCKEICEKICNKSCKITLECGHKCIGLCGEKCPTIQINGKKLKLCRECHRKESIFHELKFGFEDEPDSKFYELECGHVFEVKGLDIYFEKEYIENKIFSKYNSCPTCKEKIVTSKRYQKYNKLRLNDINVIKQTILKENNMKFKSIEDLLESLTGSKTINDEQKLEKILVKEINVVEENEESIKKKKKFIPFIFLQIQKLNIQLKKAQFINLKTLIFLFSYYYRLFIFVTNKNLINLPEYIKFKNQVLNLGNLYLMNSELELEQFDPNNWLLIKRKLDSLFIYIQFFKINQNEIKDKDNFMDSIIDKLNQTNFFLEEDYIVVFNKVIKKFSLQIKEEEKNQLFLDKNLYQKVFFKCQNDHLFELKQISEKNKLLICPKCSCIIDENKNRFKIFGF